MNPAQTHQQNLSEQDASLILQKILENARTRMEGWVDGNGMHKSAVRISEKNLVLTPVHLTSTLHLIPIEQETRIERPDPSAISLDNRADMDPAISQHIQELLARNDIIEKLAILIRDRNFGIGTQKDEVFKDASIKFMLSESCKPCHGSGKSACQVCHGNGQVACQKCSGQGQIPCAICHGMKNVPDANGNMQPCHECQGFGQTPCATCHQNKSVTCNACQGSKQTKCKNCNATGKRNILMTVDFKAEIKGHAAPAPDADIPRPIEDLLADKHLHILPTPAGIDVHSDRIEAAFSGFLPHGTIGFSLNGKRVNAKVLGQNGILDTNEMFMDSLVKPGISALNKIARGPMATAALFQRARTYRMVSDVTDMVSRMPKKKILKKVQDDYPVGLSEKYCKAMIKLADVAVGKITVRPRWIGTGISAALFGLLIFAWFYFGIRPDVMNLWTPKLQLMVDGLFLGIGLVGSSFIIKKLAHAALKNMLGSAPPRLPKAGDQALVAFAVLTIIFLMSALIAPESPGWLDIL